jgi:hypothetical protein
VLANIAIPSFLWPYAGPMFSSIAVVVVALLVELAAIWLINHEARAILLPVVVLLMNVLSAAIGMLIMGLLPEVYGGPNYVMLGVLSFPLACVLSILIEYPQMAALRRVARLRRPLTAAVVGNILSYLILAGFLLLGPSVLTRVG